MENKKDLGKLFKERLGETEITPNDNLWTAISETLDQRSRKRRVFWLWNGLALLLFFLGVSYTVFNYSFTEEPRGNENKQPFIQTDSGVNQKVKKSSDFNIHINHSDEETKTVDSEHKKNTTKRQNSETDYSVSSKASGSIAAKEINSTSVGNSIKSNQNQTKKKQRATSNFDESGNIGRAEKTTIQTSKTTKRDTNTTKPSGLESDNTDKLISKHTSGILHRNNTSKDSLEHFIKPDSLPAKNKPIISPKKITDEEMVKVPKPKLDTSEWLVSFQAGPNFYNFLSKGTPFDENLSEGQAKGSISYSYGALLNIPLSEKTTFRLGYKWSNFTFVVKDAISSTANNGMRGILTNSAISKNRRSVPTAISTLVNAGQPFNLKQKSSYGEVPFEIYYTLKEGKLNLHGIGGFSAMILGKSSVTIETTEGDVELGKGNFLKKTAFTINVGLGLRYKVSDRVSIDLEPDLRYQFGAFESAFENLHPIIPSIQIGTTLKL